MEIKPNGPNIWRQLVFVISFVLISNLVMTSSKLKEITSAYNQICINEKISFNENKYLEKEITNEFKCFNNFTPEQKEEIEDMIKEIAILGLQAKETQGFKRLAIIEKIIEKTNKLKIKYNLGESILNIAINAKTEIVKNSK